MSEPAATFHLPTRMLNDPRFRALMTRLLEESLAELDETRTERTDAKAAPAEDDAVAERQAA